MKLPEDRKEKIKLLVVICNGIALVCYLIFIGVIKPHMNKKKKALEEIEQYKEELVKANLEIDMVVKDRKDNTEAILKIKDITDKYALMPRLGDNYQLGAQEIIETLTLSLGNEIEFVREVGRLEIPRSGGNAVFKAYTARVSLECGYNDLLRIIEKLEQSNPYACISGLSVSATISNPGKHKVTFDMQWPIWAKQETAAQIEEQLEEAKKLEEEKRSSSNSKKSKTTEEK